FSDLYSKHAIGTSGYMWWDSLITYCAYKNKDLGMEYNVLEAITIVIKKIYKQSYQSSKKSAVHGIEHIKNC
ncbi:hypothetical protein QUF70_16985, partial [Desulfobacterales bacterium HSG17]|nr:hypothetical protein [Desulfobacterales bacterium HSG17]